MLLRPASDVGAQVIVYGQARGNLDAIGYHAYKFLALRAVLSSHRRLARQYQAIVGESAGCPGETNLRDGDTADMGFAEQVDYPPILVADTDAVEAHLNIPALLALLKMEAA